MVDTDERFEVMQPSGEAPHAYGADVDPDTIVSGDAPEYHLAVVRCLSAPGLFRGLPTPRFHP